MDGNTDYRRARYQQDSDFCARAREASRRWHSKQTPEKRQEISRKKYDARVPGAAARRELYLQGECVCRICGEGKPRYDKGKSKKVGRICAECFLAARKKYSRKG